MAHEVEQMAYAGAVPWHGLGNKIQEGSTIEEWQVQAGLNWTVSKRPVQYGVPSSTFTTSGGDKYTKILTFKDKFVLARDTDQRPYAVVSNRYKPVQPKEVLEFFRDLVRDFDMQIHTAGSLRDGQRIWALAKTGQAHKVMGVDKIDSYLMLATSFDLSFSTVAQFTSVCVVCNNTLQQSFANHTGRVKIPHFRDFKEKSVKEELGIGRAQWESFTTMCEALGQVKLDAAKATEVLNKVWRVEQDIEKPDYDRVHVKNVIDLFSGKAIGADLRGQTGWGLVNAVTQYVDQNKRARNPGSRLDSAWFGEGFQLKQRAVNETLLLAA